VFYACEIIQLFSVVFFVVRTVHKLDFKLLINVTDEPGGRSLAEIASLNPIGGIDVCLLFMRYRDLCDGPIPRPEESDRARVCVCE
jgi:hypothetical protein